MINFVAQIRIEVNNLWRNSQEKKSFKPSSSKTFPPVLCWGFSLYGGSMQSTPSNFAEEYKCQKGGCCLMKDSNLQESNMKEVFCRYIRKAGKIIYPKNGKYFYFYVTA